MKLLYRDFIGGPWDGRRIKHTFNPSLLWNPENPNEIKTKFYDTLQGGYYKFDIKAIRKAFVVFKWVAEKELPQ